MSPLRAIFRASSILVVAGIVSLFQESSNSLATIRTFTPPTKGIGLLAMVTDRTGDNEIYSMWPDGTDQIDLTNDPASDTQPAWSPDGQKIAFISNRSGNAELYVMNGDGSNVVKLTNDDTSESNPSWSPHGNFIAFTSDRTGNDDIFWMPATGGAAVQLTNNRASDSQPAWSPDGTQIAFRTDRDGNSEIYRMNSNNGSHQTNLTNHPAEDIQPAWSPDSRKIAFTSDRSNNNKDIFLMDADGSGQTNLTNAPAQDIQPVFSPSGTRIAFTSDRTGSNQVFLVNVYLPTNFNYGLVTVTHDPPESVFSWQPLPAFAPLSSPIQHVVVIFMENHSFDNVLGKLCVEQLRCDGVTQGELSDGTIIDLPAATDSPSWAVHSHTAQEVIINGGEMNGWDLLWPCDVDHDYQCYEQYRPDQVPTLTSLAEQFVISDRTFESDTVGSWGGHLNLAGSQLDGFYQATPRKGTIAPLGPGWGCNSGNDGDWAPTPTDPTVPMPLCIPQQDGSGAYRPSMVPWEPSIMDRLQGAGLSWRFYAPAPDEKQFGWSICPTFADCYYTAQRRSMVPRSQFRSDALNGDLPNLSFVIPISPLSQHNPYSMIDGDNYIAKNVNAVMRGPDWDSTAIFITYDDCGCYYDHVPPPPRLGIREPMVIVSPYVRPAFTDSNVASFDSILSFVEHTFGLAPLSADDGKAYYYSDSFDYAQEPLAPMDLPLHPLTAAQRAAYARDLRKHPPPEDDPEWLERIPEGP